VKISNEKGSFLAALRFFILCSSLPLRLREFYWLRLTSISNPGLTALVAPFRLPQAQQQKQEAKPEKQELAKNVDVRKELIANVDRPDLVPKRSARRPAIFRPYEQRGDHAGSSQLKCGCADGSGRRNWFDHFRSGES